MTAGAGMVEVFVARLGLDSSTSSYVVILQEKGGKRLLPIWIGQPEAESIVAQMNGVKRERPMTHDLCKNVILGMGGALRSVIITRVEKNTYFAELHIHRAETVIHVDARPSDSIAIALRMGAPIFAPEQLLTAVAAEDEERESDSGPDLAAAKEELRLDAEQLKRYLEGLRPEDFGKFTP